MEDEIQESVPLEATDLLSSELLALFAGELNPVAPKAQKKVPIPEG